MNLCRHCAPLSPSGTNAFMDFTTPPALATLLDRLREFLVEEVIPLEPIFLQNGFAAVEPSLREKRKKAKALGFWLPQLSKEHGGMGLSLMEHALVSEELGKTPLGHYVLNCQAPDAGNMEILARYGTEEQKRKWLRPLLEGEIRSCFSMTEPDLPGSNPVWMATRAVASGDDYVLDGRKWFTTAADGAAFAIVMAVTNPEAEPHQRASQIIVPTSTPGFRLVRNISVMGERGEGWFSHSEIVYENCRVPKSHLLGEEGKGFVIAQERLGPGRIHHCMRWIGICERAFDLMCRHVTQRELSPGKRLGEKQLVQAWIADSRAEIDAARLMVLHAAWRMEKEGTYRAREQISTIKYFVADVLRKVLDRAIQAHGALGMTDDIPLAFFYRNERAARIYDGADEVHKSVVARRILREYGMRTS